MKKRFVFTSESLVDATEEEICFVGKKQPSLKPDAKLDDWHLMRLADDQDCEAYEVADLERVLTSSKSKYKEFYNDVKQPSDYVKEDW